MRRVAAFASTLALLAGCAGPPPAPPAPLTEEAVRAAAEEVTRSAAARDDLDLVEGGLRGALYTWRWEERWEDDPRSFDPWSRQGPDFPLRRRVQERVLVGPEVTEVPWRRLHSVRARHWLLGSGVELGVEGAAEPLLLRTGDAAEADALAAALDLLRRARGAAPPPP